MANDDDVPYSGTPDGTRRTSRDAAKKFQSVVITKKEQVYAQIVVHDPVGITDREIERALGWKRQLGTPRRWQLWLEGRVKVKHDEKGNPMYRLVDGRWMVLWVLRRRCAPVRTSGSE